MKPGDVYTGYDGKEYIWHWWETDTYKDLLSVIQEHNGKNPNLHTRTHEHELINAIHNTGVNFDKPGWYWNITKQNLIDIREWHDLCQNNLNNNRITDNNRHEYDDINNIYSNICYNGYSTDDTIDDKYQWFDDWIKHNKLQRDKNEMLSQQEINRRLQNNTREDMKQYIDDMTNELEQDINSAIQRRNNLSPRYNDYYLDYDNIYQNRNRYNNNLRSNIRTDRNNQNNNGRWGNVDLNNVDLNNIGLNSIFANHTNNTL